MGSLGLSGLPTWFSLVPTPSPFCPFACSAGCTTHCRRKPGRPCKSNSSPRLRPPARNRSDRHGIQGRRHHDSFDHLDSIWRRICALRSRQRRCRMAGSRIDTAAPDGVGFGTWHAMPALWPMRERHGIYRCQCELLQVDRLVAAGLGGLGLTAPAQHRRGPRTTKGTSGHGGGPPRRAQLEPTAGPLIILTYPFYKRRSQRTWHESDGN
jgi:hypothetical protein